MDKFLKYGALVALAAFVWYEFATPAAVPVASLATPLDSGSSEPTSSASAGTGTILAPSQTGGGLFGNPTGLGNNPVPMPTSPAPIPPYLYNRGTLIDPVLGKP